MDAVQVPDQFLTVTNLGAPVAADAPSPARVAARLVGFALYMAFVIAAMMFLRWKHMMKLPEWGWWVWVGSVVVSAVVVIGALQRSARRAIVVYEEGFAYSTGDGAQAWTWDQVTAVNLKAAGENATYYEAETSDGSRVTLTRLGELGVEVEGGRLAFRPRLLGAEEWLREPAAWSYRDVAGHERTLTLPAGSLAFTFCQTPVTYVRTSGPARVTVTRAVGSEETFSGDALDTALSRAVFGRTGEVRAVRVEVPEFNAA